MRTPRAVRAHTLVAAFVAAGCGSRTGLLAPEPPADGLADASNLDATTTSRDAASLDSTSPADAAVDASADAADAAEDAPDAAPDAEGDAALCCVTSECGGHQYCFCSGGISCCALDCVDGFCSEPFPCGGAEGYCMSPGEYCILYTGGQQPTHLDGGAIPGCLPTPPACFDGTCLDAASFCACLRAQPQPPCGGAPFACSVEQGGIVVTCEGI